MNNPTDYHHPKNFHPTTAKLFNNKKLTKHDNLNQQWSG
jgi:hypothetical protein